MDYAQYLIDGIFVHRESRVRTVVCRGNGLVDRRLDWQCLDLDAGSHQCARRASSELHRVTQAHLLAWLENAALRALGDQKLDLFRRMNVVMTSDGESKDAQDCRAAAVQNADEPAHQS